MSARARHAAQVDDFPRAPPRREGPEITSPRSGVPTPPPPSGGAVEIAAVELIAAVAALKMHAALQARIGIATGLVVVG